MAKLLRWQQFCINMNRIIMTPAGFVNMELAESIII